MSEVGQANGQQNRAKLHYIKCMPFRAFKQDSSGNMEKNHEMIASRLQKVTKAYWIFDDGQHLQVSTFHKAQLSPVLEDEEIIKTVNARVSCVANGVQIKMSLSLLYLPFQMATMEYLVKRISIPCVYSTIQNSHFIIQMP